MKQLDAAVWKNAAADTLSPYDSALCSNSVHSIHAALRRVKQARMNLAAGSCCSIIRLPRAGRPSLSPAGEALAVLVEPPWTYTQGPSVECTLAIHTLPDIAEQCSIPIQVLGDWEFNTAWESQLRWAANGKQLVLAWRAPCSFLKTKVKVKTIDCLDGASLHSFSLDQPDLDKYHFDLSVSGKFFAADQEDGSVQILHTSGELHTCIPDSRMPSYGVGIFTDDLILVLDRADHAYLYNLHSKQPLLNVRTLHGGVLNAWSHDTCFSVSSKDESPSRLVTGTGRHISNLPYIKEEMPHGEVWRGISPDLARIAVHCTSERDGSTINQVHVYEVSSGESAVYPSPEARDMPVVFRWSPTSTCLVMFAEESWSRGLWMLDVVTRMARTVFICESHIWSAAWSRDGCTLFVNEGAVAYADCTVSMHVIRLS